MPAGYRSLEPNLSCCPAGFECLGTREIFGVVSAAALMNLCFRRAVGGTVGPGWVWGVRSQGSPPHLSG